MRFAATSKWNAYALGGAKTLSWAVYVKKTTVLTDALTAGTWMDVSSFVDLDSFPDCGSSIEYELGQFTSNAITLVGLNIAWWEANIFNATSSQYLEVKIVATLSCDADVCTDVAHTFSGLIDKNSVEPVELSDRLTFAAFTYDELAKRLSAGNLVTRYLAKNITGSTNGIFLKNLFGVFPTNANISSYPLKPGVHTITYEYNAGSPQLKLDDGAWVAMTMPGTTTLANATVTQKLDVYSNATPSNGPDAIIEEIIVTNPAGETLPYSWFRSCSARSIIRRALDLVGVTSQSYDALEMPTYDSREALSWLDIPPDDPSNTGYVTAQAAKSDGTLYVAVGGVIYARTPGGVYSSLVTVGAIGGSDYCAKMFYDGSNNLLWIVGSGGKVALYNFSSLTDNITATGITAVNCAAFSCDGGVLLFLDNANHLRRISNAGSVSTLFTGSTVYGTGITFKDWADGAINDTHFVFTVYIAAASYFIGEAIFSGGSWSINSSTNHPIPYLFTLGAYHPGEARVYYYVDSPFSMRTIRFATEAEGTVSITPALVDADDELESFFYDPTSTRVYFTRYSGSLYYVHEVTGTPTTVLCSNVLGLGYPFLGASQRILSSGNGRIFGLLGDRRLFMWATTLAFYVEEARGTGLNVGDLLNKVHQAFFLLYTISSSKCAYVYRRGDGAGTPITTGNTLSVTLREPSDLSRKTKAYPSVAMVSVSNGVQTETYDGSVFGSTVMSDARILTLSNDFIPSAILRDLAYYVYQFMKTDRDLYMIDCGQVPLFQFEPLDNCSVTFTGKIVKTGSGPIYSTKCGKDGSVSLEVLI